MPADPQKEAQVKKQQVALVVGALAFVYMFVPEPTDLIPIVGWLDEGLAAAVLMWALRTLNVTPADIARRMAAGPQPATVERDVTPDRRLRR